MPCITDIPTTTSRCAFGGRVRLESIQASTGVNIHHRKWTPVIDETVHPLAELKGAVEATAKAYSHDVRDRPEFNGTLRLFPEFKVAGVEPSGAKKRKLQATVDFAVGLGNGDDAAPRKVHLLALRSSVCEKSLLRCIVQAAHLHKTLL
ncbi:hypothetical protein HDU96_006132 [Phlyctochytrium bullatum]|nr:hypothetical protein HDU96_006132 [Phlyctochytrium bullatum]